MTDGNLLTAYLSVVSESPTLFNELSEHFPDADVSRSRHLLGIGESITIVLTAASTVVAVLQYLAARRAAVQDIRVKQGAIGRVVIIHVAGRTIDEIAADISSVSGGSAPEV
ncbi:MAG: hypothetical protein ACXW5U_18915 [Thermoanaerobaculia bacterium]